jgi:hypothetical protein
MELSAFCNLYLLIRQPVEFINKLVDLPVGCIDLALEVYASRFS